MIVDVRILVEGASDVEVVSRALQGMTLGSEYNVTVSSIIPTTNIEIAKKTVAGADLLIIATDADRVGRELAEQLYSQLSEMVGMIERMKLPLGHDLEHVDVELVRKELKNALVRAGLKSLGVIPEYMELRKKYLDLKGNYELLKENSENLKKTLEDLKKEVERLKKENGSLKVLLEKSGRIFKVEEIWNSMFKEEAPPDEMIGKAVEKLGLSGKIIVGQGHVYAEDPELIEDLFRAIYLSLKVVENERPNEVGGVQSVLGDRGEKSEHHKDVHILREKVPGEDL